MVGMARVEMHERENGGLPDGWVWTTLGDVVDSTRKRANPQGYSDLPYVGLEHIEAHTMRRLGSVPAATMRSSAECFEPDDVLYGRLRPYLNKVYRADIAGLCSAEFIVFRKTPYLDSKYLQYLLNSWPFVSFASHLNTGDRPRVDFEQLAVYPFPLPPLAEQQRIVAEIEKQITRLDAGVAALKRARAALRRYRASVLKAACEGKLVPQDPSDKPADQLLRRILDERRAKWEADLRAKGKDPSKAKYEEPVGPDTAGLGELPVGWSWASPEQIASPQEYALAIGPFGSNLKVEDYRSNGVPLVFVRNIRSETFDGPGTRYVSLEKAAELRAHYVYPGDVLITKMGDPPGDACLYPMSSRPAIITADCIKWTVSPILQEQRFLVHAINSEFVRRQVLQITQGVAQLKISLGRFKTIAVPLPPLNEQVRIVDEVERLFSVIERIERVVEANTKRAERLRQSILKRAFEGKLVTQDPADEPASVLLERIRTGRGRMRQVGLPGMVG